MQSLRLVEGNFAPRFAGRSEGPMDEEAMQNRRELSGTSAGLPRGACCYRSFRCGSSQRTIIPRNHCLSLETEGVLACGRGIPYL